MLSEVEYWELPKFGLKLSFMFFRLWFRETGPEVYSSALILVLFFKENYQM